MYGIYLWGIHFEKSTSLDIADMPPKFVNPSGLPIVHLTLRNISTYVIPNVTLENKPPYIHHTPVTPRGVTVIMSRCLCEDRQ